MPRPPEDDDLHETVSAMADRIGLKGRDRDEYIHEHMTRGGYRMVPSYEPAGDDDDDSPDDRSGGGFFPGRQRQRPQRDDRGTGRDRRENYRGRTRQSRGDSWYD